MSTLETILAVVAALSGIGNLTQWLNLKAVREKATYEADAAHIENLKAIIEMQAEEIKRLQERQAVLEERIKQLEDCK